VFLALAIQQATRMYNIVICGLFGSTVYFHIISQTTQFKKNEMSVFNFSTKYVGKFSHLRRTEQDTIIN
jgi:hypothetical protein